MGRIVSAASFRGLIAGTAAVLSLALGLGSVTCSAQTNNAVSTETTLAASSSSEGHRTATTLEMRVYPATGGTSVGGDLTVLARQSDGSERAIGSTAVKPDGTATFDTTNLRASDSALRAVYSGDAAHTASSSSLAVVHPEATGVPGFTLSAAPTSLKLVAGTFGNTILTLTPTNGFNAYVTVSCSGLPLGTSCTFTPTNVFVAAPAGRSTITIQTTAPSGSARLQTADHGLVYAVLFPGILALAGIGAWRRNSFRNFALVLLVSCAVAGMSSCADRYRYFHNPPVQTKGTPVGTTVVTIQATAANGSQVTTQTIPIALTVTSASGS